MDISLKFWNQSNSTSLNNIVFFQNSTAFEFSESCVAWKVIRNCGFGNYHPFVFPEESYVSAGDSYGNYTPHLPATSGDAFHVYADPSGNRLKYKGPAQSCQEIELANDLKRGAISANVFKDDRLFAHQSAIAPGQKAVFVFKPMLVVAVVNNVVKEGNQMVSAVMSQKTELSLLGVRSADIVLTGGGADNKATPFKFQLENVVWV